MRNLMRSKQELIIVLTFMALLFFIYIWVYLVSPFAGLGNDLMLNLIYLVFSVYPVILLRRILGFYGTHELPRRIWMDFFIGFGLFFIGDVIWTTWNMSAGEVPSPSVADMFYAAAYIFLAAGLLRQYHLIYSLGSLRLSLYNALIWLVAILLAAGIVFLRTNAFRMDDFIEYLYPALDLLLALVAFFLMRTFQQGSLARPLWGFLVMFAADLIYAVLVQSGTYSFMVEQADYGRLLSDIAYNLSYIAFALGFWGHFSMLKFGAEQDEYSVK